MDSDAHARVDEAIERTRVELAPDPAAPDGLGLGSRATLLGRYTLLSKLGEGGMGVVYAAYDEELERKVALKLMRPRDPQGSHGPTRIYREAQAMAKLSHPNVAQVYDVQMVGGQVFMAMEHVAGETLRAWALGEPEDLKDSPKLRPWREVLAMFLQAGAGLAAAHAAGLVHRDFKPDNVLVGADGRARVVDFGLARSDAAGPANLEESTRSSRGGAPVGESTRNEASQGRRARDVQLTAAGALLGTPAYMSPEQHLRLPAEPRSDQFSFCVALYEALYGERPFPGKAVAELRTAILAGRVREPPPGRKVPGWLRRVLLRGLAVSPDDRFPTMAGLLAALSADPGRARRRWLAAAVVAGAAISGAAWQQQQRVASAQLCKGAEARLAGVWDEARADAVERALLATGQSFAAATWSHVQERIDRYVRTWLEMHVRTCEATWVRGEQSQELLDLRMACLSEGLDELRALVDVLAEADAAIAERAVQATSDLRPLARCEDAAALRAWAAPPPRAAAAVQKVHGALAQVRAEQAAGRYKRGLELAQAAVAAAAASEYGPVLAEALLLRGRTEESAGEYARAEKTLIDAYTRAEADGLEEIKAGAATWLLRVVGDRQARDAEGMLWGALAGAVIERLGDPAALRVELLAALGAVHTRYGRKDAALAALDEALRLEPQGAVGLRPQRAVYYRYRGNVLYRAGEYAAAQAEYERAVELGEASLGADHPDVANSVTNLGESLRAQGQLVPAEAKFRRALAIWQQAFGSGHPSLAAPLTGLGAIAYGRGDMLAAADYYGRVVALFERVLGPEHPDLGLVLGNLGDVQRRQGRLHEARATLERALAIAAAGLGRDSPMLADARTNLAHVLAALGEPDLAAAEYDAAVQLLERAYGTEHPELAQPLAGRARLALARGRAAEAVPLLERAVASRATAGAVDLAELRLALATALWDSRKDRARARALADRARAALLAAPPDPAQAQRLREAEAWLAEHPLE